MTALRTTARRLSVGAIALALAAPVALASPAAAVPMVWRPIEPERYAPLLQITEVAPDTRNVGGGDAFEFVEVLNASDAPQHWDDFALRYLYPLVDLTTLASATWPTTTPGAVIAPGETLVVWIRTPNSAGLTVADFNREHGTSLRSGESLVEVDGAGLANGSLRGVEIVTRAGVQVSRAYYNTDTADHTSRGTSIEYGTVAPDAAGEPQPLLTVRAPSPGRLQSGQRQHAPVAADAPGTEPVIVHDARQSFLPGRPFDIEAWVTDDALLRSVKVAVSTDVDPVPRIVDVAADPLGLFRVPLAAADTMGRSQIRYQFIAFDGTHKVTSPTYSVTASAAVEPFALRAVPLGVAVPQEQLGSAAALTPTVRPVASNGDAVAGTVMLAAGDGTPQSLSIDGVPVDAQPALTHAPVFAFEATLTDAYFRNGVVMGDQVLTVFDEGFYGELRTVEASVPLDRIVPDEPFSVRIYSGTKAAPHIDPDEANDDFAVTNLRLALPDGRTLRPTDDARPTDMIAVGDGDGAQDFVEATFVIPADAFTGLAFTWDTAQVRDGDHVFAAHGADGASTQVRLTVDNAAPVIAPSIEPGTVVRGENVLDAQVTDAGAGVAQVSATVDGAKVALPHAVSSLTGVPGEHVAVITATDRVGNVATTRIPFVIPAEAPVVGSVWPRDGASVGDSATLAAMVTDAEGDSLEVTFPRGESLVLGDQVSVSVGDTADAGAAVRSEARPLTAQELAALDARDGDGITVGSERRLPYVLIEANVDGADVDGADAQGGEVRVRWQGEANDGAKVLLHVWDPRAQAWVEMDRRLTGAGGPLTLEAVVPVAQFAADGTVVALVQHSEGFAGDDLSSRESVEPRHHPDDAPRSSYDFTLAWESDTQYYNARDDIYDRQVSMHDYVLDQREALNLQYLIHTGDIVDTATSPEHWERAEAAYRPLDDAGLPYGVLAGNHDVDQQTNDYTEFSAHFGAERFEHTPWYGGDHEDNRGHYDLVTAGGIDFLFLYMGWAAGDAQLEWMNRVLAQYPERIAFVNLHEYMLTTGGLGPLPQRIHDEVVSTNPNVRFVLSGHYHDAYTRLDSFDDDGDGSADRTVTSMLFDYQDLPHGGEGYLRLLHFDNSTGTIRVRTYSDYLRDYSAVHPSLAAEHQEFVVPYSRAGIEVRRKALTTDAVQVDVLSGEALATFDDVPAGTAVEAEWAPAAQGASWYVRAVDPYGATAISDVRSVSVDP